eukprot:CAMPEP_0175155450 /NCGR_PEP_ID=MMETSP0087-20121206/20987_1 /TAXON_ID=136419 /ORGANISM="Unknown Unknown, Strain D1" /LENGTH=393 /DNA_ID=CAMNT_0016442617 /DNA_START=228 /DNA_END=1406 /DNA_ORIENTATION=+
MEHLDHEPEPGCCTVHFPHKTEIVSADKFDVVRPVLDQSQYPVVMGTNMVSLVKAEPEKGLRFLSINKPQIGPNDVLVKVLKTAICGTDLHIWNWDEWSQRTVPTPMTTGHEFVGIIEELGDAVQGYSIGERVTGEGHITCGHCRNCRAGRRHLCRNTIGLGVNRPGCFAEFVSMPATNLFPVPAAVPNDIAAFMDPLGNAVHSALSFDLVGEDVLITGAGPIGMMCASICKQVGARHVVVTDVNAYRLNIAKHCGADAVVDVSQGGEAGIRKAMNYLGMQEGFDVGLEMSGNASAMKAMLATMNNGGKISMLGIPASPFEIDWDKVIFKGLVIKGIYGREMFETWYKMSNLLTSGLTERIRPVLTHDIAADDYERGFNACASSSSGKVLLDW